MRLLRDNVDIRVGRLSCVASEVEDTEARKLAWERRLAEQLAQEAREERDEDLLSYTRDLADRAWRSEDGLVSEVWRPRGQLHTPDTVPPDTTWAGYSREIIPDAQLPPVHVKKEKKAAPAPIPGVICQPMSPPTLALSPSHPSVQDTSKTKIKREDQPAPAPPKSLFDRPRPPKMVARRPMASLQSSSFQSSSLSSAAPSLSSQFQSLKPDAGPEWSPAEDWALHQAVTSTQELSLAAVSALGHSGHTVNWDLVSDMVCSVSYCYRPAKQCRARWEASLVPREEGRLTYDTTPKKLKKDKKLGMKLDKKSLGPGGSHSMKTGALFRADNNNAISSTFSSRFETIKSIANKRTPTNTPLLVNPTLRNPKHAAVLAESGVDYDAPVSPVQVAASRAERIQASKARSAQLSAGAAAATPQLPTQPQLPQSPVPTAAGIRTSGAAAAVSLPSQPAQAVVVGISQPLQGAVLQTSGGVTRPAQQSVQQTVTALSVQDLLKTVSTSGGVAAITTAAAAAGSSAGSRLSSGQILVTQAGKGAAGQSGAVQVANQRLTPHQLAQLKQQAIQKRAAEQQKQRLAAAAANTASAGASSAATAVSGAAAVVTTAAAAGTSKLTVTSAVPGVAASIGRGQMINRQNIRNITDPEFKALLAKQVADQRLTSHQLAQHQKLHQKWAAEQQKQRLAAAANTAMVGAGSAPTVGEAALELPNRKTLQARKAEEEFKVVVDDTSKETEMKNSSLEALCSSIETKIKSGNDQLQSKIENSTSELKRKYASIETKMEKGSSNVEKRIATLESKLESATESIKSMIEDTSIKINNFVKPRCPICFDEMSSNTKIAQCISGHLLCWGCKEKMGDKVCAFCEQPVNGRAFGMEAYLRTIFG